MHEQTYRATYDKVTNILHVYLKEDKKIEITRPVKASAYIDYDVNKEKVGIEILLNTDLDENLDENLDDAMTTKAESFNEAKMDTYD